MAFLAFVFVNRHRFPLVQFSKRRHARFNSAHLDRIGQYTTAHAGAAIGDPNGAARASYGLDYLIGLVILVTVVMRMRIDRRHSLTLGVGWSRVEPEIFQIAAALPS